MSWTSFKLSKLPDVSFPIFGHSATLSLDRDVIVFGGYDYSQEKPNNTTFLLNTSQSNGLTKPHIAGSLPPPMYGHSATQVGRKMFVFGGNLQDDSQLNDMYQLNTINLSWSKPRVTGEEVPLPRYGHSATLLFDSYILIFGGRNKQQQAMNDLHLFNTERNSWIKLPIWATKGNVIPLGDCQSITPPLTPKDSSSSLVVTNGSSLSLGSVNTSAINNNSNTNSPVSRGRSSTISSPNGTEGSSSSSSGSGNSFNSNKNALEFIEMIRSNETGSGNEGAVPSPRYYHSCTLVGNGSCLVIFGGFDGTNLYNDLYILSLETLEWSKPQTTGDIPTPRCGHSSVTIGNKLYIFGGSIQDPLTQPHCDNELYIFDCDTLHWSLVKPSGIIPSPRTGHICLPITSRLLIIGGSEGILNCKTRLPNSYYVLETLKLNNNNISNNLNLNLKSAFSQSLLTTSNNKTPLSTPKSTYSLAEKDGADNNHNNTSKSPQPLLPNTPHHQTPNISVNDTSTTHNSNNNNCNCSCNLKFVILKSQNEELNIKLKIEREKRLKLEKEFEVFKSGTTGGSLNSPPQQQFMASKQQLCEIYEEIYELWNYYERRLKWKEIIEKNSQQYLDSIKFKMEQFSNIAGIEMNTSNSSNGFDDLKSTTSATDILNQYLSEHPELISPRSGKGGSLNSSLNRQHLFNTNNEADIDDLIDDHMSVGSHHSGISASNFSANSNNNNNNTSSIASNTPLSPKKPIISHSRSVSNPIPALSKLKKDSSNQTNESSSNNGNSNTSTPSTQKSQKIFKIFKKNRISGSFKAVDPHASSGDLESSNESTTTVKSLSESLESNPLASSVDELDDNSMGPEELEKVKVRKKLGKALKTMISNKEKEKEKEKQFASTKDLNQLSSLSSSANLGTPNGKEKEKESKSKKIKLFGGNSKKESLKIEIIEKVINHIEANGIEVENIFRLSGNMDTVKSIVKSFQQGEPNLNAEIQNVSNALKHYLRILEPPLIPYEFFLPLLDARKNEDIETIRNIFWRIPPDNRQILTKLVSLLVKISEKSAINKMNSQNLSIVFGPTILKSRTTTTDLSLMNDWNQLQCGIMQAFIDDFNYIFNESPIGSPKSFIYDKDEDNISNNTNNNNNEQDESSTKISNFSTTPSSQSSLRETTVIVE